jgi:hypothetical protein
MSDAGRGSCVLMAILIGGLSVPTEHLQYGAPTRPLIQRSACGLAVSSIIRCVDKGHFVFYQVVIDL